MRTAQLASALLADRNRVKTTRADITECFMCGVGMMYRGNRFCSERCRDYYDAGNPGHAQTWRQPEVVYLDRSGNRMKPGAKGFGIQCAHCRKDFDSTGLRCCSADCERRYRERESNLATMAEVGIEASAPKRVCLSCGGRIPTWRKGRKVSSATRFCSPKCARKAKVAQDSQSAVSVAETVN
jgi:hypothetical protein